MSIIKRKKQSQFFMMSNHATQKDLTSLSSIGLLAYIISLPHDFRLYKTQLQNKFTRRTVDNAFKELVEKKYIAGFSCYVNRKKAYYYLASDEKLTDTDYDTFITETYTDIINDCESIPKNLQPITDCQFTISSDVQNVLYKMYSTESTVLEVPIQMKHDKDIPQINNNKETEYVNIIHSIFDELNEGLFTKDEVFYFTDKILLDLNTEPKQPHAYFTRVIEMIVYRRKKKLGLIEPPQDVYNWLVN